MIGIVTNPGQIALDSPEFSRIRDDIEADEDITDILIHPDTDIEKSVDAIKPCGKKIWVSLSLERALYGNMEHETINFHNYNTNNLPATFTRCRDAIEAKLEDIEGVDLQTNSHLGLGGFSRWISGYSYLTILKRGQSKAVNAAISEMQTIASWAPNILAAGKLAFLSMIEVPIEREAYLFRDNLENAFMLQWLNANNIRVNIARGAWALDKDMEDHMRWFVPDDNKKAISPIIAHQGRYPLEPFPYQYYQDYLAAGTFYSDIGCSKGINRGNHVNLITAGYKGTWIPQNLLPHWKEWKSKERIH